MRRDVGVSQDVRLSFQVFQPMLDDIADADDADEFAVVDLDLRTIQPFRQARPLLPN